VLAGIIVGQAILFGPSLIGLKILLPIDFLNWPSVYLPTPAGAEKFVPHDTTQQDLVLQFEPERRFTASELHAGRLPLWATYQYAGSPLVWPKFSPFILLSCLVLSPVILPWVQLVEALAAGLGLYLFCRRALGVGYWAAVIPAWCYPMTGFFVFWQGFPTCASAYWFPWLMLAVDQTVRRTSRIAWLGLSLVTCLVLISGHLDVAGQALLASGVYGLWRLADTYWGRWSQEVGIVLISLTVGWCLGFVLAAPHLFPLLEYAQTGARMEQRRSGVGEERPPVGLEELPQTVLPDLYGTNQAGSKRPLAGNQIESSAAIYVGLIATLLVAPLAWCSRRRRSINIFFTCVIFVSLSWCLNIPGIVDLLRLPGLRMMSHNRLVFVGAFAILAMASIGLDLLPRGEVSRRRWFLLPTLVLVSLGIWCLFRIITLPYAIDPSQEPAVAAWFRHSLLISIFLCGLGVAGWMLLWLEKIRSWFFSGLAIVLVGDLLVFAFGRSTQADPAYYYPRLPILERMAASNDGRMVGYVCFPAALAQTHNLRDIRGYDSIDPGRLMAIMDLAIEPSARREMAEYAKTQWFAPQIRIEGDKVMLPPVLDMLGVRYVLFHGTAKPQANPAFQGEGYVALANDAALPRAFVPRRVEVVSNDQERLNKLGSSQFDPSAVAYVEEEVSLPTECRGTAKIASEIPTRVNVAVKMETSGLLVLSDLWDKGWHAYLNGNRVPILRTNHAVRGVVVPAGDSNVEFRYESASLALGTKLAGGAAMILVGALFFSMRQRKSDGVME